MGLIVLLAFGNAGLTGHWGESPRSSHLRRRVGAMKYEFHPEALEEYNEAGLCYAHKEPGLDLRFIVSVENAIDLIVQDPLRWRQIDEDVRRCLTRVFTYAILYTMLGGCATLNS